MPVYEYECAACNHRFEEWQKITDKPVKVCPSCKARKVERLISQTSFQLKGGGWYGDLYASSKPGAGGDKGAKAESNTDSKAKPAAESGTKSETSSSTSKDTPKDSGKDRSKDSSKDSSKKGAGGKGAATSK